MKIIKQILNYVLWLLLAFLFAIGYIRIIIGPKSEKLDGIFIFDLLYNFAFIYTVPIIGGVIGGIFILLDIFYLKKKLNNNTRNFGIRFLIMFPITLIVAVIHYFLEKVIDVI